MQLQGGGHIRNQNQIKVADMNIIIDSYQFKKLLREAAELGVANYIKTMQPKSDSVSQREAFRLYGESRVRGWLHDKMVTAMKTGHSDNSRIWYSRAELMAADTAERHMLQVGE